MRQPHVSERGKRMILDYIENYKQYAAMLPNLEEGMALVQTLLDQPAGRYEGSGGMYAMVQTGETYDISADKIETHERYLDVQIVYKGREILQWEGASQLDALEPYNQETDFKFYKGEGKKYLITENMFYILFPADAHKCRGKVGAEGEAYRKIVLKLPVIRQEG